MLHLDYPRRVAQINAAMVHYGLDPRALVAIAEDVHSTTNESLEMVD